MCLRKWWFLPCLEGNLQYEGSWSDTVPGSPSSASTEHVPVGQCSLDVRLPRWAWLSSCKAALWKWKKCFCDSVLWNLLYYFRVIVPPQGGIWNIPGAQICLGRWALEINKWNKALFYGSRLKHSSHFCQSHGANRWEFLFTPSGRVEHKVLSFCFGRTSTFMMTIVLHHQYFFYPLFATACGFWVFRRGEGG